MSRDFTLSKYAELLQGLKAGGYRFLTFEEYCSEKDKLGDECFIILRHDVDRKPENALATARIEQSLGIRASYYFRVVEQNNKSEIIKEIVGLGHELGYHYEDITLCGGDAGKAIEHFKQQLDYFRQFYPVTTICMHGALRSRYDGRDLWKQYDYHEFGIIGEPYFDVDFSRVFYLTDTGRRWDGFNMSLRDKIPVFQDEWVQKGRVFHTTDDVLRALESGSLPRQILMTTHPQRWTDHYGEWFKEMLAQSAKNIVKGVMVKRR